MSAQAIRALATQLAQLDRVAVRAVVGEVSDDSPLTVALAGGAPVPAKRVAGSTLSVGDLVLCLTWPGQIIVIGAIE